MSEMQLVGTKLNHEKTLENLRIRAENNEENQLKLEMIRNG